MEKLEERITKILEDGHSWDYEWNGEDEISVKVFEIKETAKELTEEVMNLAIEFHTYILNNQAMKDMSGRYLIAGIGAYTPEQLFNKFLEEKYK